MNYSISFFFGHWRELFAVGGKEKIAKIKEKYYDILTRYIFYAINILSMFFKK